jgi:hypothetical protein
MIEIGVGIIFVGFMVWVGRYVYLAARITNELKKRYQDRGYYFPEDWD